jgi:Helix-turn-helix domain
VVKRAVELFELERRPSCSPFVEETWHTRNDPAGWFISVAASHWEMVVTRRRGAAQLTVRGPETRATIVPIPEDAEFFGIEFSLGAFMPSLPPRRLLDGALTFPPATATSFWLDGWAWEVPGPDNADVFVDRLVHTGLLIRDPIASAAVERDVTGLSDRSVQRRVARATGLTRGAIRQMRRAERALGLLARGESAAEVAGRAGYADQAHLTRSLKRFFGQTPTEITASGR